MSKQINYYKIGVFVLVGLVILILLVVGLGASQYFEKETYIETYFNQSVQGLQKGSLVKYQGLPIGHVSEIKLLSSVYPEKDVPNTKVWHRFVYAKIAITDQALMKKDGLLYDLSNQVKRGLRIRMASESITGGAYLEVGFLNGKAENYFQPSWKTDYPYLPSMSSTISKFIDSMGTVMSDLKKARLDKVAQNMDRLINTADRAIKSAKVNHLSQTTVETLEQIKSLAKAYQGTAKKVDQVINNAPIADTFKHFDELSQSLNKASLEATQTLKLLNKAIENSNKLLQNIQAQSQNIVTNLDATTENVQGLTANLKQNPSQLIFSAPPPHLNPGDL